VGAAEQAHELKLKAAARGLVADILKFMSRGRVKAKDDTVEQLRVRVRAGQEREEMQTRIYEDDASQTYGEGSSGAANRAVRIANSRTGTHVWCVLSRTVTVAMRCHHVDIPSIHDEGRLGSFRRAAGGRDPRRWMMANDPRSAGATTMTLLEKAPQGAHQYSPAEGLVPPELSTGHARASNNTSGQ
jgi:hypothetical protein